MVSGTVAQWEYVWGLNYGNIKLLYVVKCHFVYVSALQTLIGNNELVINTHNW